MHKPIWIAAAVLATASAGVFAEDLTYGAVNPAAPALKYDRKFTTLDRNGDYSLNRSEAAAQANLSGQFDTADANKDGALSQAEFSVFEAESSSGVSDSTYNRTVVPIR